MDNATFSKKDVDYDLLLAKLDKEPQWQEAPN